MLSKKKRITKEQFLLIMKKGGMISVPLFTLRYIAQKSPQYAFVAPKTLAKGAVERNRTRRQGYNTLRKYTLKPYAGIFLYKKEAKNATYKEIEENITLALSKLR